VVCTEKNLITKNNNFGIDGIAYWYNPIYTIIKTLKTMVTTGSHNIGLKVEL